MAIIAAIIVAGVGAAVSISQGKKARKAQANLASDQRKREEAAKAELIREKEMADERAREDYRRRRKGIARSGTTKTSPLGLAGQADITEKTLLGS